MRKKRDDLWKKIVRQKGTRTWKFGTLSIYKYSKNEKACSENTKGVAKQPFDKAIMCVTHGLTQPSRQEARNRDGIILVQSPPVGVEADRKCETK